MIGVLAGIPLIATLLAACSGGGAAPEPTQSGIAHGGTLTVAAPQSPVNLNPVAGTPGAYAGLYNIMAYEPIIKLAADGHTLVPGLATAWKFLDTESQVLELTLNTEAKFSDGTPVTSAGIQAFLEYYEADRKRGYFDGATYETPSDDKLVIHLSHPLSIVLQLLADSWSTAGFAVSPKALENPDALKSSTVGAGPYMLDPAQSTLGEELVYVPNPYYYDKDSVHWDKVVFKVIPDASAALSSLQSGQVQVIAGGGAQQVSAAEAAGLQVVKGPESPIIINTGDLAGDVVPALKDVRVRQALSYAIDREAIASGIFDGNATVDQQLLREGLPGYDPDLKNAYPYDPDKAKQLLTEAGYPNGFDAGELLVSPANGMKETLQAVQGYWEKLGVKVSLLTLPSSEWNIRFRNNAYPLWATNGYYSDLLFTMWTHYTPGAPYPSRNNEYPELDPIRLKLLAAPPDTPEAESLAKEANDYLVKNALGIYVVNMDWIYFASKDIGGITVAVPRMTSILDWYPTN